MIEPNTPVIVTATAEAGLVVRYLREYGGTHVYVIRIGRAEKRYPETDFEVVDQKNAQEIVVGPEAVQGLLTRLKVAFQLKDQFASFEGTRTDFFPYQYKPLLKLERGQLNRILIADEVGLGKTIETGFLIVETIARQPNANIVVVCPPMLREKWRRELLDRFSLEFQIFRGNESVKRVAKGISEIDEPLRAIVAYETIRTDNFMEGLEELPIQRHIDLLVADEAHRARNPSAKQTQALEILCDRAHTTTVAFLTATPIQTADKNLFQLLHMLLPGEFPDVESFRHRLESNRCVVAAERAMSDQDPLRLRNALEILEHSNEPLILTNPFFPAACQELHALLAMPDPNSKEAIEARIRAQETLFQVNLLSPVLTRTRRRDVHEQIAIRSAVAVDASLTPYEQTVYDTISHAIFSEYKHRHGNQVARFVLKGFQQRFASSLWAAINDYRRRNPEARPIPGVTATLEIAAAETETEEGEVDTSEVPDKQHYATLATAISTVDLDRLWKEDSKWGLLRSAIEQHGNNVGPNRARRKLIIFSYYKKSLDLLEKRLQSINITYERIDGDVPTNTDPELDIRQQRINNFRDKPNTTIMLASQVGCEGLDFQFCDTVVNWDLPWNPMMVEQRIGRIDRIGQLAPRIFILNIACNGTVEWEILQRLYMRLDLFESSIGDLEEVLGEMEERLCETLFNPELSPADRKRAIEQEAVAAATRKLQLGILESEASSLIGQDRFLLDEVDRLKKAGRYLSHEDLYRFIHKRIKEIDPTSTISLPDADGVFTIQLKETLRRHINNAGHNQNTNEWRRLHSKILGGSLRVAFEYKKQAKNIDLLSASHPFVRALVPTEDLNDDQQRRNFAARVQTDSVPPGLWALLITRLDYQGGSTGAGLVASAVALDKNIAASETDADALMTAMLRHSDVYLDAPWKTFRESNVDQRAEAAMIERVQNLRKQRDEQMQLTRARREAVSKTHWTRLIDKIDLQIAGITEPRILNLNRGKKARFERDRDQELDAIQKFAREIIAQTDVFLGLIEVYQ